MVFNVSTICLIGALISFLLAAFSVAIPSPPRASIIFRDLGFALVTASVLFAGAPLH